jgi:hypothetical protein
MAQFGQTFYTAQLPKETTREALPAGVYISLLDKAEIKTTKAGDGQYIDCQFRVVDGQHKGRSFFDKINISNPSQQAVEIGLARLNTILTIGGLNQCGSTEELEQARIHILAVLGIEEHNGGTRNFLNFIKDPKQQKPQPTMQQSYVAQQAIQPQQPVAQPVYQQPQQAQQNWQQPQPPVQQQQYAPVLQAQQTQQWQSQPQQPVAPLVQTTAQMLDDEIPF